MCQAAKAIGNTELENKFAGGEFVNLGFYDVIITPRACARGKEIGLLVCPPVIVVIGIVVVDHRKLGYFEIYEFK